MSLRLGDMAPDFVAQTTKGTIRFHEWIGDSWAVLFTELLRAVDSIQLTTRHPVATPANWQPGEAVVVNLMMSDEKARALYGDFTAPRPYLRIFPLPE